MRTFIAFLLLNITSVAFSAEGSNIVFIIAVTKNWKRAPLGLLGPATLRINCTG